MNDVPEPREEVVPILRVAHALAAAEWYTRLGFTLENVHRFAPHLPVFATIARESVTLFLSEHTGDAQPGTLIYLRVRNVQQLAAGLGIAPHENPWGWELEVADPDGNRLRIGTPSWW